MRNVSALFCVNIQGTDEEEIRQKPVPGPVLEAKTGDKDKRSRAACGRGRGKCLGDKAGAESQNPESAPVILKVKVFGWYAQERH